MKSQATSRSAFRRLAWLLFVLSISGILPGLAGCERKSPVEPDVGSFLEKHWSDPLAPQGEPPSGFSPLEASLAPEACGNCHVEQYRHWQSALHSHTMGPGILWQFELLGQEEANRCLRCHAPLAEQKALVARSLGWKNAPASPPPAYVPPHLDSGGLVCAACHLREHRRYGPPPRSKPSGEVPHAGFVVSRAFQDSRFCANCHQFPEDGPSLAGKLREDTYRQWQSSPYAPGQSCQSCHMPDGKHLWRGIHDPDMLRRALAVELKLTRLEGNKYRAEVIARNQGAGHHLPTYMVPKIGLVLTLRQPGAPDTELGRDVIGWQADVNIEREEFDTRIPAGESRSYAHEFKAPSRVGWDVELRVDVAPREHYERMFQYSQVNVSMSAESARLLKIAIEEAAATRYTAQRVVARP